LIFRVKSTPTTHVFISLVIDSIMSRKTEDVHEQQKAIERYRTQIMIPRDKIDQAVIEDLQLPQVAAVEDDHGYDSLRLIAHILEDNKANPDLEELRTQARTQQNDSTWTLRDGLLLRSGRVYVTGGLIDKTPLRTAIIREAHEQPLSGHPGRTKLRQLLQSRFYWPGQGRDIDRYCANCHACRRSHVRRDKKPGFLHQLPIPDRPWQHISVDFKKCPESRTGHNMVAIFVDRLGKRPITIPVRDTITAKQLVPLFLTHVVRHVGLPDSIVSDRGPQFVSDFWDEVCKRL
jgi:hypothetical protein